MDSLDNIHSFSATLNALVASPVMAMLSRTDRNNLIAIAGRINTRIAKNDEIIKALIGQLDALANKSSGAQQ